MNLIKKKFTKFESAEKKELKTEMILEMTEISIRKAEKKDFPAIKNLLSTYFLDLEGLNTENFILVENAGKILGCAAMITIRKDGNEDGNEDEKRDKIENERRNGQVFLEIHSIAVHPNFRGKGIGRKLVESLIKTAKTSAVQTSNVFSFSTLTFSNQNPVSESNPISESHPPESPTWHGDSTHTRDSTHTMSKSHSPESNTPESNTPESHSLESYTPEFHPLESQIFELYVRTTVPDFFEKLGFEKLSASKKQELWKDCTQCGFFEKCTHTALKYTG